MNNEIIQGMFYEKELQLLKMKEDGLYIIEKLLEKIKIDICQMGKLFK